MPACLAAPRHQEEVDNIVCINVFDDRLVKSPELELQQRVTLYKVGFSFVSILHCNSGMHSWILIIFGSNVYEKVDNWKMV